MQIEPSDLDPRESYQFLITAIVPRPIALVSTIGRDGVRNLAPFSFFMGVSTSPLVVALSVGRRKGAMKDTSRNIAENGEFVVNVVDEDVADAMVRSSGDYGPEVDEFALTGLTPVDSMRVRPPRVGECKVSLECRETLTIGVGRRKNSLILGEVQLIHVADEVLDGRLIDPVALRPVGRLGGNSYCRVRDIFERERPQV